MPIVHNAKHWFNQEATSVPSTSLLSALDGMDPRNMKGFYEDFTLWSAADLVMEGADFPMLSSGQWDCVAATDNDLTATQTVQANGSSTATITCTNTVDGGGFMMQDGGSYRIEANEPAVFEVRFQLTATLATAAWFLGMIPTITVLDNLIEAGGAGVSPTDGFGFYGHDSTGATGRFSTWSGSVTTTAGTVTVVTATFYTFTMVWDGVTARGYLDGVSIGSTTDMPTAGLTPAFALEEGASSGGPILELDYMLFYDKTGRAGVKY